MLETEFLKLKYHANVESNTDEVDAEEYFNNNYKKIDANAKKQNEDLTKIKEDLEQENTELASNMPWNTVQGKSIHITDSAKYSKNKLSISGDMEQEKRSGKNLFNVNDKASTYTVDEEDWISVSRNNSAGSTASYTNIYTNKSSNLKVNTEYSIVAEIKQVTGEGYIRFVSDASTSGFSQFSQEANYNLSNLKSGDIIIFKGTSKSDFSNCSIMLRTFLTTSAGKSNSITFRLSVLEDTSVTTENFKYEKYGAMPSTEFPSMPIVATGVQKIRQFGKNIFDGEMEIGNISTTDGKNTYSTTAIRSKNYISINNLNVIRVVRNDGNTGTNNYSGIRFYDKDKKFIGTDAMLLGSEKLVNTSMGAKYFRLVITNTADLTLKYAVNQDGSEEYEPYNGTENTLNLGTTELCAIKDTNGNVVAKDRLVFRNGKWQWEKKIGKVILNGTEDYVYQNNARFFLKNTYFTNTNRPSSVMTHIPVSNYFEGKTMGQTWSGIEGISNDNNGSLNIACNSIATTVQEFKTWLSTHNLIVYYILENSQYIDCTAEQSAILDKLHSNFALQKGTNNIIVESENGVGVNLELEYMQDNILKNSYEVNEVNTGKKWIDGKDIYRKVVEVTNLSSGNNRIAHNINNFNELIDIRGTGNWNGNWQTIPRLVTDAVSTFGLGLGDINDTKFLIQVGTNYTNFTKAYIIIEYTKAVEVVE